MAFEAKCGSATVKYYMNASATWTLRGLFRERNGRVLPGYEKLVTLDANYDYDAIDGMSNAAEMRFAKQALLECYPDAQIKDMVIFYKDDSFEEIVPSEEVDWDEGLSLCRGERCPFIEPL